MRRGSRSSGSCVKNGSGLTGCLTTPYQPSSLLQVKIKAWPQPALLDRLGQREGVSPLQVDVLEPQGRQPLYVLVTYLTALSA
jgi:hypothetical protein